MEAVTWLRPEYQGREDELINLAAGADLVGVTRAAVSNWSRRHANFPKTVMLAGLGAQRTKWVVREEFLEFARHQLNKPRTGPKNRSPRRPRGEILGERITHWEWQVARLTALETRQAKTLARTRASLQRAQDELKTARDALAAEAHAIQQTTIEQESPR